MNTPCRPPRSPAIELAPYYSRWGRRLVYRLTHPRLADYLDSTNEGDLRRIATALDVQADVFYPTIRRSNAMHVHNDGTPMGFPEVVALTLVEEHGRTKEEAAELVRRFPDVVVNGIMGGLEYRATASALEMREDDQS